MKVVILAGGYGTRISEESHLRPKPMLEIGGKPILWHIMKEYSYYGTPYMQESCNVDTSDNLIIYGHHINNSKMLFFL
jgi:bifunctional N-acetylglucosamine-1-phosphate-uridyltransferase/glucosamine-1-phosphate-acetyltransferase GlmU-like protein